VREIVEAPTTGLALVLCDMDNLKVVNDTHGHEAGDRALCTLADALRTELRRSDEAYRLGGDEFAVILPGASRLDAEHVMRRLRQAVTSSSAPPLTAIEASFGVAVFEPGDDPERLVARADEGLYEVKRRKSEAA
jgi:diguanylate cyclase (GGDEF)-like protein